MRYISIFFKSFALVIRFILRCIIFPMSINAWEVGVTPDLWWIDLIFNKLTHYNTETEYEYNMFCTKKYCYSSHGCISVYPKLENGQSIHVYDIDRITSLNPLLYEFANTKLKNAHIEWERRKNEIQSNRNS